MAVCEDGSGDLLSCPGAANSHDIDVGTIIEYRYKADKCLITPTVNPTPCYKQGDKCMMQNMFNAMWLSFATICTVGYGDIFPQTSLGKAPVRGRLSSPGIAQPRSACAGALG